MNDTRLGKIAAARFGFGGYQDGMFGLTVDLTGGYWGCAAPFEGAWGLSIMPDGRYKWTEEDRDRGFAKAVRKAEELCRLAKVRDIGELVGKPIEATFEGTQLASWRILIEVL